MEYKVTIKECSKELTAREKLFVKDNSNAVRLDTATAEGALNIEPDYYAILSVYNEKAEDTEYNQYVVVDTAGVKYITGSESFFKAFLEIFETMADETEAYSIDVYRMESKNYKGKSFITCSIV